MKTICVNATGCYDVKIGCGLLNHIAREVASVTKANSLCIVSDSNVWPLYGISVKETLCNAGYRVTEFVFPAGEQSKNAAVYIALLEFLAESRITRSDCILALGGGVVGDVAGFAAATFLRGVDYIQVPTTLLAAVDSSVGGKTAIDLAAGKNLAGAFYQPKAVICDVDTLSTLPAEIFLDGCAEVVKYALLYDPELLAVLEQHGSGFDREAVIARCVELKRDVVLQDEFDRGQRQKLNLGHTMGHGIEAASNFTVSHGKAVAMGMAMICRASVKHALLDRLVCNRILSLLGRFSLPITPDCGAEAIFRNALGDKKRSGATVNLIVPNNIGDCHILPVSTEELKTWIEEGL